MKKALFPSESGGVEHIVLNGTRCAVYIWTPADGTRVAVHMIMNCPKCGYPINLAPSEFDFDSKTLRHEVRCAGRWKKVSSTCIDGETVNLTELNEKGKPIIIRCGWRGYILDGDIKDV